MGAIPIHDYIRDNYCPTLDSTAAQHFCEDSLSKTTSATTTAQPSTQQRLSTSARIPSPSTTLACSSESSSTTLSMELFMFARPLELAQPESTLVTSASRVLSGWRLTWKTRS